MSTLSALPLPSLLRITNESLTLNCPADVERVFCRVKLPFTKVLPELAVTWNFAVSLNVPPIATLSLSIAAPEVVKPPVIATLFDPASKTIFAADA